MRAMVLRQIKTPLELADLPDPQPGPGELLLDVLTCGICRTDLHVVDGDLTEPNLPLVPGHQIVGRVRARGPGAERYAIGQRVGVPWLGGSCGACKFCRTRRENLCREAIYTGYQRHGGFAEQCVARERFAFPIPEGYPDLQAAPLLCAGLIGYRAYRMALDQPAEVKRLGLYGFGAAAHILIQVARHEGRDVYAFTRPGDERGQAFARELGAVWAGSSAEPSPELLDAAILFAPVGSLVPASLRSLERGGVVVCAGIHMSDIPSFPYSILWQERVVRSVANLTRADGEQFLALAPEVPVKTQVHPYPLERANEALEDLREGRFEGAAVVVVRPQA